MTEYPIQLPLIFHTQVTLTVPNRWLCVLDKTYHWVVEPGTITVFVGGPSNVMQANVEVNVDYVKQLK